MPAARVLLGQVARAARAALYAGNPPLLELVDVLDAADDHGLDPVLLSCARPNGTRTCWRAYAGVWRAFRVGESGRQWHWVPAIAPWAGRGAIGQWGCRVSIGGVLAAARRQAGLTITQVSQRTCIRETIVRGIERDDFCACGADFYARGHIRAIARAVGVDGEPLVGEYPSGSGRAAARAGLLRCWSCSRRSLAWSPITSWRPIRLAAPRLPPASRRSPRIRPPARTRPLRARRRRLQRAMARPRW